MRAARCLLVASVTLVGCDAIEKLRQSFHPDAVEKDNLAGLRVEVDPPTGITILLDDVRVASISPYKNRKLAPGKHRLEVRAMGYHPFEMLVVLKNDEVLTVPVSLRSRPPAAPPPAPKIQKHKPPPEPPEPPAPVLPTGIEPILLTVVPQPGVPVLLDGEQVGRQVRLRRAGGELTVGVLTLGYAAVGGTGILTLTIAEDDATWFKQSARLKAGSSFRLHRGAVRLRRVAADGTDQAVLIKRQ